jgi:hypothetical protein
VRVHRKKSLFTLVLVIAGASYIFGAFSYHMQYWPMRELRAVKHAAQAIVPANQAVYDQFGRLVGFRDKDEIECPRQTEKTWVILIAGQSNAANSGGQRYAGKQNVINYFGGKCYQATSPLLGATGILGDSWTPLGNKLVDAHLADQVILIATAISGTSIMRWQPGADMNEMLQSVLRDASKHYKITHILWEQGAADLGNLTEEQYVQMFTSLVDSIRRTGTEAPVYVSVSTRCELTDFPWTPNNPIAAAQKEIADSGKGIFPGVDSDALLGPLDRMDDCHLARSGQEKMSDAWVKVLSASANAIAPMHPRSTE